MASLKIEEIKITYSQEGDSGGGKEYQDLSITTQDAGGGKFYVISTDRWAFNNVKEFTDVMKDFNKRLNLKTGIVEINMEEEK